MRVTSRALTFQALGLALLGAGVVRWAWERPREPETMVAACRAPRGAPASASAAALRAARYCRLRAQQVADRERYRLEAWDPDAAAGVDFEPWRLQLLAADPTGALAQSRTGALRAAALARSAPDAAMAEELLALIEHERGDHRAELEHARRLVALPPGRSRGEPLLRRALRCTSAEF
jgi:hypothetical protein